MLRVLLVLGFLVLVPAIILFWRARDRAGLPSSSPKIVGTSTLSHGGPPARPPLDPASAPTGPATPDGR